VRLSHPSRAASNLYAAHKQQLVSTIQQMSHTRLNGMPNSIGSMRSHSETEKHIAVNGINPSSSAPADGFFTATGKLQSAKREAAAGLMLIGRQVVASGHDLIPVSFQI